MIVAPANNAAVSHQQAWQCFEEDNKLATVKARVHRRDGRWSAEVTVAKNDFQCGELCETKEEAQKVLLAIFNDEAKLEKVTEEAKEDERQKAAMKKAADAAAASTSTLPVSTDHKHSGSMTGPKASAAARKPARSPFGAIENLLHEDCHGFSGLVDTKHHLKPDCFKDFVPSSSLCIEEGRSVEVAEEALAAAGPSSSGANRTADGVNAEKGKLTAEVQECYESGYPATTGMPTKLPAGSGNSLLANLILERSNSPIAPFSAYKSPKPGNSDRATSLSPVSCANEEAAGTEAGEALESTESGERKTAEGEEARVRLAAGEVIDALFGDQEWLQKHYAPQEALSEFLHAAELAKAARLLRPAVQAVEGLERMAAGQEQEDAVRKEAITTHKFSPGSKQSTVFGPLMRSYGLTRENMLSSGPTLAERWLSMELAKSRKEGDGVAAGNGGACDNHIGAEGAGQDEGDAGQGGSDVLFGSELEEPLEDVPWETAVQDFCMKNTSVARMAVQPTSKWLDAQQGEVSIGSIKVDDKMVEFVSLLSEDDAFSTMTPVLLDLSSLAGFKELMRWARRSLEATDVAFGNGKVDGVEDGVQAADVQGAGGAAQREQESHKFSPEFSQLTAFEPLMRLHGWTYDQVISLVNCASVERMDKDNWLAAVDDYIVGIYDTETKAWAAIADSFAAGPDTLDKFLEGGLARLLGPAAGVEESLGVASPSAAAPIMIPPPQMQAQEQPSEHVGGSGTPFGSEDSLWDIVGRKDSAGSFDVAGFEELLSPVDLPVDEAPAAAAADVDQGFQDLLAFYDFN